MRSLKFQKPVRGAFALLILGLVVGPLAADEFDDWIATQKSRSAPLLQANISPTFAARGAVVAAPSFQNPQYFSYWVRDGALAMDIVVTLLEQSTTDTDREHFTSVLEDYRKFSRQNQLTPNPSGGADAKGLGEPRFNADGTVYQKWGRPQNDGPALRALTLIRWANRLLDQGKTQQVKDTLYDGRLPSQTVIKNDLEFVSHAILDSCVDLWEERFGKQFYTRMVQREALIEGAKLATRLGDGGAAAFYQLKANELQTEIEKHKDPMRGCLIPMLDDGRTFDAAVILAVLHSDNTADDYLSATNDFVWGSTHLLFSGFDPDSAPNEDRFEINRVTVDRSGKPMGRAIGRYAGDHYDGDDARARSDDGSKGAGNPWVLCTLATAELGYRAANRLEAQTSLPVTATNLAFIKTLDPNLSGLTAGTTLSPTQTEYKTIVQGLRSLGERQLRRIRYHANPDGSLSEQMNRRTGFMWGAPNLSWSHASFVTAVRQRKP